MARLGTYYIGRVLKLGNLDQEGLIQAIREPQPVEYRGNSWTLIDVEFGKSNHGPYIYGKLCKYKPEGSVDIIDPYKGVSEKQYEPNLQVAVSPFVYIPQHSGIAFLSVTNQIEKQIFVDRFCNIIENYFGRFFVGCQIESITDLKSFSAKVNSLDGIFRLKAKVSPPNPLFGKHWKKLKEYLEERNVDKMTVVEEAPESEPLSTELASHIENASNQTAEKEYTTAEPMAIGDAAILMAADGYGNGVVIGKSGEEWITIKTSETTKNFTFQRDPEPLELFLKAVAIFEQIQSDRHLDH